MKQAVRSHWSVLAFVLFFPLIIMLFYSEFVRDSELNARLGWFFMLGGFAYFAHSGWLQKLFLALLAAFTLSGAMDILYAITFGGVFTDASFDAIAQTNGSEGLEFIWAYATLENTLIVTVYLAIAFLSLKRVLIKTSLQRKEKFLVGFAAVMLIVAIQQITMRERVFDTMPGVTGVAIDYARNAEGFEFLTQHRIERETQQPIQAQAEFDGAQTYVVVIGESATRNHMSLYGYQRPTTPQLESLQDELVVFDNVISAFAQTTPSLSRALTQANTQNNLQIVDAVSLAGVMKNAGFKVWWLSNQQPRRAPFYGIAKVADEHHYVSNDFYGVNTDRFDGYLLPYYEQALQDSAEKKVIFLHLMGSHLQYENRYPQETALFNNAEGVSVFGGELTDSKLYYVNGYDNSIHYNDQLLAQFIKQLKQQSGVASLLYFSDHGEEVFASTDFKGHGPDGTTHNMVEVPFVVWRNQAYQQQFAEREQWMQANTSAPGLIEDTFQFVHCWSGVSSEFYRPTEAMCDQKFTPRERKVYGKEYENELRKP